MPRCSPRSAGWSTSPCDGRGARRRGAVPAARDDPASAAARPAEAREDAALRDRHLRWHVAFAEEADALREVVLDRWRAALQREYADLRTALEWGLHDGAPDAGRRPAASLAWLWHVDRHGGVEPFGAHRVLPSRWRRTRSRRRTDHRCSATAASRT